MQTIHVALQMFTPVLALSHLVARTLQIAFERLDLLCHVRHLRADLAQRLLAFDHARVRVAITGQSQPVGAEPYSVLGHHGFAGAQALPPRERIAEGRGRVHRGQQ